MNDTNAAPLRAQPDAAGRERSVVPLYANPLPADPGQILAKAQPPAAPKNKKMHLILWIGGAVLAAQLFAPPALKPTVIAGGAAADFYAQIMAASQINSERTAHQNQLAQRLAAMEADYADSRGKCFWGVLVSPEIGQLCADLVDANYVPAIRQIRAQLNQ